MSRHILITGAAGGLGLAVADAFAAGGDRVTGADVRVEPLDAALRAIGERHGVDVAAIAADLGAPGAHTVVDTVWDRHGPVDVLVNAAGIWPATPLLDMTEDVWDRVMTVNTRAPVMTSVALARRAVADGRAPCVVNIASGAALRARPGAAHYATSKAALEMATRSCALEFGPYGIRVNAVSPGFVRVDSAVNPITDAYADAVSPNPLGTPGHPEDVAGAVHYLASAAARWITGTVIRVDGGSSAGNGALPVHWSGATEIQAPG
ncbi:MAG TPA: SDR family oxidoreductase [Streptosporangiaceae bacterium]|jgi:NAD(P)-dependent dehydrogenase (short-subunit alcohol dehydrogenase family)